MKDDGSNGQWVGQAYIPLWFRYVLFFLKSYGVDKAVLERRSWETVQAAMAEQLTDISLKKYWFQFFYLCCGQMA